ncbi:MAG: hypothetical protein ACREE3_15750, partial [Stellaceae bacterium]
PAARSFDTYGNGATMTQTNTDLKWDNLRPARPWPKIRGRSIPASDGMPGMPWSFSHHSMADVSQQLTNAEG